MEQVLGDRVESTWEDMAWVPVVLNGIVLYTIPGRGFRYL